MKLSSRLGFVLSLIAWSTAAHAARVPIVAHTCDLTDLGSSTAQSVAWSAQHGIAVVDTGPDQLFFLERDCTPSAPVDLTPFGSTSPSGVTYVPTIDRFAITDVGDDEIYLIDRVGTLAGQCDLRALGITSPQGIAWDPERQEFLVIDAGSDTAFFIDDAMTGGPCVATGSFGLSSFGAASPEGVSVFTPGVYAVYDSGDADVYLVDAAGNLLDQFDMSTTTGVSTSDVTYVRELDTWFVSSTAEELSELDIRGTSERLCDTTSDVTDVAYRVASSELMFVDNVTRRIEVMNAATCAPTGQVDLGTFGLTNPTALFFDDTADRYLVADADTDHIYAIDYGTGAMQPLCDVRKFGVRIPSGVAYIPQLDHLLVIDEERDKIVVMNSSCEPLHVRSTDYDAYSGAIVPTGLAFHRGTGATLLVDAHNDQIYISNVEGRVLAEVELAPLGMVQPTGIVSAPGMASTFFVSDAEADAIFAIDVPRYAEARSMSGFYQAGGTSAFLFDRGEGRFTGTVFVGPRQIPVFGQYNGSTRELVMGGWPAGQRAVLLEGSMSPDFEVLDLASPAAPMVRTY